MAILAQLILPLSKAEDGLTFKWKQHISDTFRFSSSQRLTGLYLWPSTITGLLPWNADQSHVTQ